MPLIVENVVLVANQFNPSITSEHWLVTRKIIEEGDPAVGRIFTPVFVAVPGAQYDLLIMAERLQLGLKAGTDEEKLDMIRQKVGALVHALPETPYIGCAQNFQWIGEDIGDNFSRRSAELFLRDDNPILTGDNIARERSAFGMLCVTEVAGARLTLAAGPAPLGAMGRIQNKLQLAFNYAIDIMPDNPVEQVDRFLASWIDRKRHASQIVASYGEA